MSSSTAPGPAPSRERASHLGPAVRRPMVLDAALAVWLDRGADGMTMNAIAEQAGVTKPVVYECFDSKAEVLSELFTREERRLVDSANAALPADLDVDDVPATIEAAYSAFFRAAVESPASWRLVYEGQSAVSSALADRANDARKDVTRRISRLVMTWMQQRDSDADHREARLMAEVFVAFAESGARLLIEHSPEPAEWTPQELAAFVTRRVLRSWD